MSYKNIWFFSAILCALALLIGIKESERIDDIGFYVEIKSDGCSEKISCWVDETGNSYFFLPSYTKQSQVHVHKTTQHEIKIDGREFRDGSLPKEIVFDTAYDASVTTSLGSEQNSQVTFVCSGNMPTMYIDVTSGNMEYIHKKKGNKEAGSIRLYTKNGKLNHSGNVESIKGRGNATWNREKKAYSLKLSESVNLLNMGAASKWILLANAYDHSNMRNKIAYDFAKAMGMAYTPDCEWVDLYLNGEYRGLYLLSERNEIHPERVDISQEGSFLISREGEGRLISQAYEYFGANNGLAYRVHQSSMPKPNIERIWASVENAILAEDGYDIITGKHWSELIDVDSWVMRFLVDEVFANYDGGGISQFFYLDGNDPSGKIYAGPVWDMDISMAPGQWEVSPPNSVSARRPCVLDGTDNSPFSLLYKKQLFYRCLVQKYQALCRPLLVDLLNTGLSNYIFQTTKAAEMNRIRWDTCYATEEAEDIGLFLKERIAFLDDLWINNAKFFDVRIVIDDEIWAWFAVQPGEYLPYIPEYENCEFRTIDGDNFFSIQRPIYESVDIYLKENFEGARLGVSDKNVGTINVIPLIALILILILMLIADKNKVYI